MNMPFFKQQTFIKLMIVVVTLLSVRAMADNLLSKCNPQESSINQCLQKEILSSAKHFQMLVLKQESYTLNKPLLVYTNSSINGNGAKLFLKFTNPNQSAFVGESISNFKISNIVIDGGGRFSESMFVNPYSVPGQAIAIGFSNTNNGIEIYGVSSNIIIYNVKLLNLHHGVYIDAVLNNNYLSRIKSVVISNSTFNNIGKSAIFLRNVSDAKINNNNITNVSGNFASGLMPDIKSTAWADGIYVRGVTNSVFSHNNISNIIRGGIVFEGDWNKTTDSVFVANDNIDVSNNKITLVQSSRGTEENGGIWVEGYQDKTGRRIVKTESINIYDNYIDNFGAKPGAHSQYGITCGARKANLYNNRITNFTDVHGYGIACSDLCKISDNVLINNSINLAVYKLGNFVQLPYQESSTILSKFLK